MATHIHMSFLILVYALLSVLSNLKFGCGSIVGDYRNKSCIESEKHALLVLKESLVDDHNYFSSWIGDDCCAWHGIGCDNRTGHVIQLDLRNGFLKGDHIYPSLLDLKYLTYLDLSDNSFVKMKIPQFLGSFKELTYLNLSDSKFEGLIPHHLGNLSNLQYLDLSYNYLLSIDSMRWLSRPSLLKHLDLSFVDISRATDWFSSINMLSNSISVLRLYSCQLSNNIPRRLPIINLTSLVSLDLGLNSLSSSSFPLWVFNNSDLEHLNLGGNNFNGSIPESVGRLISLSSLDLSDNNFQGSLSESIGRLTSLTNLDLYANNLEGLVPKSIGNLTALSVLDLSRNNFQGLIPESVGVMTSLTYLDLYANNLEGLVPKSIGNLTALSGLVLSSNKLHGSIPHEMGNLTKVEDLIIDDNELSGCLPEALCRMSNLRSLSVSNNHLSGSIPRCVGELSNLNSLDLTSNSWEGFLSEHHFVNLTNLLELYISTNANLVFDVSSKWVPVFHLAIIQMESLKVGPKFPHWLRTQRDIIYINMRNTSISDSFPADFFASLSPDASAIDLSNNDIHGELSLMSAASASASNSMFVLALSNNRLTGEFPAFLCNLTSLTTLVLSGNNFSGELPQCLENMTQLMSFDVMNNSFSGNIHVSLGSLRHLSYLNLHGNKFQGKLPLSFQNLTGLVTLDVGKNNLSDVLPLWTIEQLPSLRFLILRSNKFYGKIPTNLCHHPSIQVLNFGHNQIVGNIPLCFGNFSAMITVNKSDASDRRFDSGYSKMILYDAKGYEQQYTSTLTYLTSIDLSNNHISGEIPEELMDLHGLSSLNLAGNHLGGRIPDKIGELKNLQFLNLSRNELYGRIPQSLSELYSLSRLDLSFNDLSGRIPTGYQLQTLEDPSSIYAGNNQLCGQPILKPCAGDTESRNAHDYNEADYDEHVWFYAGIGPGLLVGFLGFCASLHFIKSFRYSYFHSVEQVLDKIALSIALLGRKLQK